MRFALLGLVFTFACGDNHGAEVCTPHAAYADRDGDGAGDPSDAIDTCEIPPGYVADDRDCDDTCVTCHLGGTDVCNNGLDEDCDGLVDEGCCEEGAERACAGGSSVGSCRIGTERCVGGSWQACEGHVEPTVEACNAADDDCDGTVDGPSSAAACLTGQICDDGACVALPRVVWTADVGLAQPQAIAIDNVGNTIVAGLLQAPLTLDGLSVAPLDSTRLPPFDVYLAAIARSGTATWLRRDGVGTAFEQPLSSGLRAADGAIGVSGYFAGETNVAGQTLTKSPGEPAGFLAVYGPDGVGRWARATQHGETFSGVPVAGPAGFDIVEHWLVGKRSEITRFDPMGSVTATIGFAVQSSGPNDGLYLQLVAQHADGSLLVFGNYNGTVASSCAGLPSGGRHAFVASMNSLGACTLLHVISLVGSSVGFGAVQPWSDGILVGVSFTGMLSIDNDVLMSSGDDALLLAVNSSGLAWSMRSTTETLHPIGADSLDNVYVYSKANSQIGARLRSFRDDGIPRWELELPNVTFSHLAKPLSVNNAGDIAIAVAGEGNITIGPMTIPGAGLHYGLALIQGR